MSTALYDKALVEKLRKWTEGTQVVVVPPDDTRKLFESIADQRNDKPIQLPMICLRKANSYSITTIAGKAPLSYSAITMESTVGRSTKLNAIPIRLEYQIDVYTRYYEEADEYMRNLVFNLFNYPAITVQLPYEGKGYEHKASIYVNPSVTNSSSSQERLAFGQFTKLSIGIEIRDAYLFDVRTKDNYSIGIQTWVVNPDGGNDSISHFQAECEENKTL